MVNGAGSRRTQSNKQLLHSTLPQKPYKGSNYRCLAAPLAQRPDSQQVQIIVQHTTPSRRAASNSFAASLRTEHQEWRVGHNAAKNALQGKVRVTEASSQITNAAFSRGMQLVWMDQDRTWLLGARARIESCRMHSFSTPSDWLMKAVSLMSLRLCSMTSRLPSLPAKSTSVKRPPL